MTRVERRGKLAVEAVTVWLMGLAVALMGGVAATLNGVPVDLGGRRPKMLLAGLVLAEGRVMAADRLIDLVWDDDPPMTARRTLQSYVSGLRRGLGGGDGHLSAAGAGYVLSIERGGVDLFVFADAVISAKRLAVEDPTGAATRLEAALESWAEPLDGLGPSLALQAMVAPFEELRMEALEALIDVELDHGDAGRAIGRLETLVREHPTRERFWTQLVRGLSALGRRDVALHATQRAREALREQLGVDPSPLLQRLERDLLDGGPQPSASTLAVPPAARSDRPGNLSRPATEFIGRVADLERGIAELRRRRVVTLTGAGGIGKTRLATELAWSMVDAFPGGVWMVELAPVTDPASVVGAVASTLSVQPKPGTAMQPSIVDWLRGRRLLLILDNCEQVRAPVSDLVDAIVMGCPTVTVLATSREPLDVPGEQVRVVPPLEPASEGVELFCDRARAADDTFTPSDEDRGPITSICRRLDGIPLAIELSAARIRSSTPAELLSRLDDRFRLLRRSGLHGPPRHHTLSATIDWSYQLLDEHERRLFERVSVFAGGFDLTSAEVVCGDGLEAAAIAGLLDSLVDKSMVLARRTRRGTRFELLETLREFGHERLTGRGEERLHRHHHLAHYIEVATRAYQRWASPQQLDADRVFRSEWENLRVALGWSVATANLPAADTLVATTGPHAWCRLNQEHADWAAHALTLSTPARTASPATYGWAAYWAFISGDYERARTLARHGIDVAPAPEHPGTVWCWGMSTWALLALGRGAEARQPARSAQRASTGIADPFAQAWTSIAVIEDALTNDPGSVDEHVTRYAQRVEEIGAPSLLARAAFYRGQVQLLDHDRSRGAIASFSKGLDTARTAADNNNEGKNLAGIISAATWLRTPDTPTIVHEALSRLYDTRHWVLLWAAINSVARWFAAVGLLEAAAITYGHLDAHQPVWDVMHAGRLRSRGIELARAHPDATSLMAMGEAMTSDQIVNYVLEQLASLPPRLSTSTENTSAALARTTSIDRSRQHEC